MWARDLQPGDVVRQFPQYGWLIIEKVERWRECVIVETDIGRMSFDANQELEVRTRLGEPFGK